MHDRFVISASRSTFVAFIALVALGAQGGRGGRSGPPQEAPGAGFPPGAEKGTIGQMSPAAVDIRVPDSVVHQDTTGGSTQSLRALCGSEGGGFAAVWQDQRDARLGLYMVRLSGSGEPLEPEQSINEASAGRGFDTSIALAPDGSGAVTWTAPVGATTPSAWARFFDTKGRFLAADKSLSPRPAHAGPTRGPRRAGATQVTVVRRRDGGYAIAWTDEGNVNMLETDASGTWRDSPGIVNTATSAAEPGVRLAVEKGGGLLCAWKTHDRSVATALGQAPDPSHRMPEGAARNCGDGTPTRLVSDPAGGFWALFQSAGSFDLRHLSPAGEPDRAASKPVDDALSGADLARWQGGLALLAQRASGFLELHLFDLEGRRVEDQPTPVSSPEARNVEDARIVSNGATLFVAWSDRRNGDSDVYGRTVDPKASLEKRLGPERRLNTDTASSAQIKPIVAGAGARAVIAWQDDRDVQPHVYARLVGWPGGFASDEFLVPAALPESKVPASDAPRANPSVAMREDGSFLVAWVEGPAKRVAPRAQLFRADGRAACEPIRFPDLAKAPTRIASVALPDEQGYLLAWDDLSQKALLAARIAPDGTLAGEPRPFANAPKGAVQEPALAFVGGDRVIAAWSRDAGGNGVWSVAARSLDFDGVARADELSFERTVRGQDWDPSVAAGNGGGFVMSWCSGARDDAGHDVVARAFDAQGRPAGPLLPISPLANEQDHGHVVRLADGSWAVAWEDDISAHDQTYLRRIAKNAKDMGPIVLVNELPTLVIPDRQSPSIAPLADGICVVWSDRRRSKGWDAYAKVLGPGFDQVHRR